MNIKIAVILLGMFAAVNLFAQPSDDPYERYIEKYKDIAIIEMQRAGIPASIKLGQALLESDAGRSDLARKANNHFGIKCSNDWDGKTFDKKDDEYNDQGEHIESCFRVYDNAEASYRAHSEFLHNPKKQFRYGQLFELDPTDYKGWAEGLRKAGYATSPSYSKRLVKVIEQYKLYKYDYMTINDDRLIASNPSNDNHFNSTVDGFLVQNDVKYVLSRDNEPVEEVARRTHTRVRSLVAYNENLKNGAQRLTKDTKVYLQSKRNSYRGKENYHRVQMGETMFEIAQQYGLKLEKLYERNLMVPGMEPAYNEQVKLKGGKASNRPVLVSEVPQIIVPPAPRIDSIIAAKPSTTPPVKTEVVENNPITEKPTIVAESSASGETLPEMSAPKPSVGSAEPVPVKTVSNEKPVHNSAPNNSTANSEIVQPNKPRPQNDFDTSNIFTPPSVEKPITSTTETTQYHTVAKGDTLWNISQRYNTSVDEVKRLNNLNSDGIKLGQRLRIH